MEAGEKRFEAEQVVIATGNYCRPRIPRFAPDLDLGIVQFHSSQYRNLSQLAPGGVLIVGAGNSGAEIAIETVKKHPTWLAGKETGHVPFRVDSLAGRFLFVHLIRALGHNILNVDTPIGRKVRPKMLLRATPLVRVKPKDLIAAGVKRVPRVIGAERGLPMLEDGRVLQVENVIWSTGFLPGSRVGGSPDLRWRRRAVARSGHRDERAGTLLRGTPLPVRDDVGSDQRRGAGREMGRRGDCGAEGDDSGGVKWGGRAEWRNSER